MQHPSCKFAIYARKSTESEDKQAASIDSQINFLTALAEKEGLRVVQTYTEEQSAKEPGRPIFGQLIKAIQNNKIDGILCWKIDRLTRNLMDGGTLHALLEAGLLKSIRTSEKSYIASDNVLLFAIELAVATQFSKNLAVDTKRGLKAKAERGWFPGFSSIGYLNTPVRQKGNKEIIEDPATFEQTKEIFRLILSGVRPMEVLRIVNEEWKMRNKRGNPICRSTFYRTIQDPFYSGIFEYPKGSGNWYDGKHTPIISRDEHERIKCIIKGFPHPSPEKNNFPYTCLIKCGECGASITAERKTKKQKSGKIHKYEYYHCTKRINLDCSQKCLELSPLEEQIIDAIEGVSVYPEFKEWALSKLDEEIKQQERLASQIVGQKKGQLQRCMDKLNNLIDMRANDEINFDEFSSRKSKIEMERIGLEKELASFEPSSIHDKLKDNLSFAEAIVDKFQNQTADEKRATLLKLCSNLSLMDKNLSISFKKEYYVLAKINEAVKAILGRLEPRKNGYSKQELLLALSRSSMMLPLLDELRTCFTEQ